MSLSSFLLGGTPKPIDSDLDALFRSTVPAAKPTAGPSSEIEKKRKQRDADDGSSKKRLKQEERKDKKKKDNVVEKAKEKVKKDKKAKPQPKKTLDTSDEDDNADIEDAYHAKQTTQPKKPADPVGSASDASSDEEGDPSQLVHESVKKSGKTGKVRAKTLKFVPPDETKEQRDARTIFVGNVPVDVAKNKSLLKQFKKHILTHVPHAKIESVRFRSVAFQTPTTKLSGATEEGSQKPAAKTPETEGRKHDRERAASWRTSHDEEAEKERLKRQTPQEKKRIAFIKQELHEQVDAVHAYVVFAYPAPRAPNLPALEVLEPHDAAALAVDKCDGTVFLGRTLRVDRVARPAADVQGAAAVAGDPKKTVFVGNLDFASKEEDLRVFFETLISGEKGPRGQDDAEDDELEEDEEKEEGADDKPKTWVTRVRIIRDRDTQLGKGFAYVQFADRECVDEILAMDESKLKFAKRKLRVQRCKTLPGGKLPGAKISGKAASAASPKGGKPDKEKRPHQKRPAVPVVVPKGNPLLGEKLAHLPKEQRKEVKAADANRIARRLAKKKARHALVKAGVKEQQGAKKDRERVRKSASERKGGAQKREQKKSRVRSERNAEKRNAKK